MKPPKKRTALSGGKKLSALSDGTLKELSQGMLAEYAKQLRESSILKDLGVGTFTQLIQLRKEPGKKLQVDSRIAEYFRNNPIDKRLDADQALFERDVERAHEFRKIREQRQNGDKSVAERSHDVLQNILDHLKQAEKERQSSVINLSGLYTGGTIVIGDGNRIGEPAKTPESLVEPNPLEPWYKKYFREILVGVAIAGFASWMGFN